MADLISLATRPVGSGKTALTLALCRYFRDTHNIGMCLLRRSLSRARSPLLTLPFPSIPRAAVVTNDIFTKEDQEFLIRNQALSDPGRIRAIETGKLRFGLTCSLSAFSALRLTFSQCSNTTGGCPHAAIRCVESDECRNPPLLGLTRQFPRGAKQRRHQCEHGSSRGPSSHLQL